MRTEELEGQLGQAALLFRQPRVLLAQFFRRLAGGLGLVQLLRAEIQVFLQELQELQLGQRQYAAGRPSILFVSSLIARIISICGLARLFRFHGREHQFQPVDGVLLGLLGRGSGLPPLKQCGGPPHGVNRSRQGHAEDVGRVERLHHPARLVAEQLLLMGQFQQAGDLRAVQRAAALDVGKFAGFRRDSFLLVMEVLDGVLQPGLLFHGQLGLDFKTLLTELPGGVA